MSIQGQEIINVGVVNQASGSDDLYTAFTKIENNFTTLFSTSSVFNNFVAGNGINTSSNPVSGTVTITNTGVTQLNPGTGITLSNSNGNITISVSGSSNGQLLAGVTNVGVISNSLTVTNSPIISKGLISVELPNIAGTTFVPGSYTNPTVTVDEYGRVSNIANNTIAGTVTSVAIATSGIGISVTGSPITSSGTVTIKNTGVTQLNAGPGINLSGSNGAVTISSVTGGGTVTRVDVTSTSLAVTGSPITNLGTINVELKNDASFSGNVSATTMSVTGSGVDVLKVSGTANIVKDLYVGGNLYVPNLISTNSTTLEVNDPLIYLTASSPYPYNYEIGIYSHFETGSGTGYQHTGIVRNHSDNNWTFFSNAAEPSGGVIDLSNANIILDNVKVGNVTSLNANLGNAVRGNFFIGAGNNLSNIQGANVSGVVANATYAVSAASAGTAGTVTASAQSNITSVGTLSSLTVTANITSANANLGNLVTANYSTAVLTTGAQPNITSVGTLGNLVVTSNVTSSNANVTTLLTASNANITGNITAGNANITTLLTASNANITGNITAGNANITGNITVTNNANVSKVNATGNIIGANVNANTLVTAPQLVVSTTVPGTLYNGSIAMDSANNRLILVYNSTIHYINVTA